MTESEVLEGLKSVGLELGKSKSLIEVSNYLSKNKIKLPPHVATWLLENLENIEGSHLMGPLHMALLILEKSKTSFPGSHLIKLFEDDRFGALRPTIAGTIIETSPTGVVDWLERTIAQRKFNDGELFLVYSAYAKLSDPDIACNLLSKHFDQAPLAIGLAYAYCGGERELTKLNELLSTVNGSERQDIKKAISRIETRIRRGFKSAIKKNLAPELGDDIDIPSGLEPSLSAQERKMGRS